MSLSTIVILIIIGVILYFQYSIYNSSKTKIKAFESIFTNKLKGSKSAFETVDIFIPKDQLKDIKISDIWKNEDKYKSSDDDVESYIDIDTRLLALKRDQAYEADEDFNEETAKKECEILIEKIVCKAEDKEQITFIKINTTSDVAYEVENSINTYLLKNKGAVSDFNLIKDIVERNCDALDSEIESQTPMPLYLGLMGTMSGIIVGLGVIGLTSGFDDIQNVVNSLMSEVAIAMFASALGVLATTMTSWKSKKSKAIVEAEKNKFYTWIQTELLPVLTSNTVSTLTLLERNLTRFNESFHVTVDKLDTKLAQVGDTYNQQIELLRVVQQLDVTKMAKANVTILEALDRSTSNIKDFASYLDTATDYIDSVKELSEKIDDHLERTHSLETIADFYKKQMDEIKIRQNALSTTVVSVDDTLQSALADLQSKTSSSLTSLNRVFKSQEEEMENLVKSQSNSLDEKIKKMDAVLAVVEKMPALTTAISKLEKASTDQAKALNTLADAFKKFKITANSHGGTNIQVAEDTVWDRLRYVIKGSSTVETAPNESSKHSHDGGKWYDKDKSSKPPVPKKM